MGSTTIQAAVEEVTRLNRSEFCVRKKISELLVVKEVMIVLGRELGASNAALARMTGLDGPVASRRYEAAKLRLAESDSCEAGRLLNRLREALAREK